MHPLRTGVFAAVMEHSPFIHAHASWPPAQGPYTCRRHAPPPLRLGALSSSHMLGLMWGHWGVVNVGSCSLRACAVSSHASRNSWSRVACQSRLSFRTSSSYLLSTRKGRTCTPKEPLAMVSVASQASAWRLRSGLRVGLPCKSKAGRGFASVPCWPEHCSDPSAAAG